jgi:AAA+ ATPase superfamily predicted ATPase
MTEIKNPFITKGYISKEYFCDREEETADILSAINNGRDLILYGKRKMGKSALIKHVFHQLDNKTISIWVDLLPSVNFDDFLTLTANAVLNAFEEEDPLYKKIWAGMKKLRPTVTYDEVSGTPNVSFDLSDTSARIDTFSKLIRLLSSSSKKVVIALDEFQQIQQYPEKNIAEHLRTLLQSLPNVTVIFSGSDQHMLLDMFSNIDQPFYQFGQHLKLGPIDSDKYVDFIEAHFKKNKRKIERGDIYNIIEWCNHRTMNIQILANRLYSLHQKTITEADIQNMKDTILKEKEDIYYTLKRVVSKGQWKVLSAFAREGKVYAPYGKAFMQKYGFTNSSIIRRVVQFCLDKGLLYQSHDGEESFFELDDVFLRRWVEMTTI